MGGLLDDDATRNIYQKFQKITSTESQAFIQCFPRQRPILIISKSYNDSIRNSKLGLFALEVINNWIVEQARLIPCVCLGQEV